MGVALYSCCAGTITKVCLAGAASPSCDARCQQGSTPCPGWVTDFTPCCSTLRGKRDTVAGSRHGCQVPTSPGAALKAAQLVAACPHARPAVPTSPSATPGLGPWAALCCWAAGWGPAHLNTRKAQEIITWQTPLFHPFHGVQVVWKPPALAQLAKALKKLQTFQMKKILCRGRIFK